MEKLIAFSSIFLILVLMASVAYRVRGGGWFSLTDTENRIIWGGFGLALPFVFIIGLYDTRISLPFFVYAFDLIALGYLEVLVPHAYAQNMGTGARPWTLAADGTAEPISKYWPAIFVPHNFSQAVYASLSGFTKTVLDFLGMGFSALFSGLIVFAPAAAAQYAAGYFGTDLGFSTQHLVRALAAITLGQPIAYLIGRFVPFSLGVSLSARSSEWGEFFNGAAWVLALALV